VGMTSLTRRALIVRTGEATAAGLMLSLLAACGLGPRPSATPASAGSGAGSAKGKIPASVPIQDGPKADLAARADGVDAGYFTFPQAQFKSVKDKPGNNEDVTLMTNLIQGAVVALDQNSAWQAVNADMGLTVRQRLYGSADYRNGLNTTIAGGDLPDTIYNPPQKYIANLPAFLQAQCADLTPYIGGDAVKDYPNLANLPTSAWPLTVFNNKIMAVPVASGGLRSNAPIMFARWGDLDQAGITKITSVDEFTAAAKQLNNPNGNRWALGANKLANWFVQVYGGPNNWRESGGKFTKDWETPEFKEAVAYHRSLWDAGLFHPDSAALSGSPAGAQYYAGRFVLSAYASWSSYQTTWDRMLATDPNSKPRALAPFKADGSGRAPQFLGSGGTGIVALKKASPDRIKELLGILNYLAAPVGTTEQLLLQYGVEGADFTRDGNGNPVPTPQSLQDLAVPWKYISAPPDFLYSATSADYVSVAHQTQTEHFAVNMPDPSVGLYSATDGSKGAILRTTFNDSLAELLFGKRPVSGMDDLVKDWRTNGGDKIRAEYEQAFQAARA
jgi:putative aldouronate transport system substrate-binding protein